MLRHILAILLVVTMASPGVHAQWARPVGSCLRECDPILANAGSVKTGVEPVLVLLYAHMQDILTMAPLNTQSVGPKERDLNKGFLMPVIDTNHGAADLHFKSNGFVWQSSPGLVEFFGYEWRIHQAPGLGGDLRVAGEEIRLYWYMSADAVPDHDQAPSPAIGAMPQVGVYARLETGRYPFHGVLIAESDDFDTAPPGSPRRVNMLSLPGHADVYEFQVPLRVVRSIMPGDPAMGGFIAYINPYQVKTDEQRGVQVMQADWRVRTGPSFPPRIAVPILEPLATVSTDLALYRGELFLRWAVQPVLGSYDIDEASVRIRSTGNINVPDEYFELRILRRSYDHDGPFKPTNLTWAVNLTQHPLVDGPYDVTVSLTNLQKTYLLDHTFRFSVLDGHPQVREIFDEEPKGAPEVVPFPAPILVAAAFGLALILRRR